MEITKEFLKENNCCTEGYEWFCNQDETDLIKLIYKLSEEGYFNWASWLIIRTLDKDKQIEYAIYAAESVLFIFEKEYPDDKRPRNAINAAKEYLKNKHVVTVDAAGKAAYGAIDAADDAYVADAAVDAAYAASNAAYAAAYAADAAGNAADAAAAAARNDNTLKQKIIEYGVKLINEIK